MKSKLLLAPTYSGFDVPEDRTVAWLLEEDNPCVRYQALTQLLGIRPKRKEVVETRARIPEWSPVRKIIAKQNRNGGWDKGSSWYLPKYKSTVWQLIILSQTGIDSSLPQIDKMCEYSFRFQTPSGGFMADLNFERGSWAHLASCLNGNVVASLCRLGYYRDRRLRKAATHLVSLQEKDGGWGCRSFGYHRRDRHSCFMGSICALEGLVEFSKGSEINGLCEAITNGCEFILMHRLFRSDHHGWDVINVDWTKPRAPWLVGYNILRALVVLTDAGIREDRRMNEAIEILKSERNANGRWTRDKGWPSNAYSSFGEACSEDKWITLKSLLILRRIGKKG